MRKSLVTYRIMMPSGIYFTRWGCPWCHRQWEHGKPHVLERCPCGAIVEKGGYVGKSIPAGYDTPPDGVRVEDLKSCRGSDQDDE